MNREILIAKLREAVQLCNYKFHTGMEYRINTEIKQLPAIWINPPELISIKGRKEGIKEYKIKISIINKCKEHTPEEKETKWADMENTLRQIVEILRAQPEIRAVTDIAYNAQEFTVTNKGEISIFAYLNIIMNF